MRGRTALLAAIFLASFAVLGGVARAATPDTFTVSRAGTTNTYTAESQLTSVVYTGTLKFVVESATTTLSGADGGDVVFTAGDFDLGNSHWEFSNTFNVSFVGQGIDVTIVRNSMSDATDTEPFDFVTAINVQVRDMTVAAGGPERFSSDALDFDNGNFVLVERVKVTESRGRGIVFDGKNLEFPQASDNNVIRDCVITGVPSDGIELLASSNNVIEGCVVTNVGGHGIQMTKSSTSASIPNKQSNDNVLRGNTIVDAGQDGLNINSSSGNQLLDNDVRNSANITANRDGIRLQSFDSVPCDGTLIQGNTSTDDQPVKTQKYGVNIASALCSGTVVTGNYLLGNITGEIRDLGTSTIYNPPSDVEPPSTPANATGVAQPGRVELRWDASTDDVGVQGYGVYRDGTLIASINAPATSHWDATVAALTPYSYAIDAYDAAGNRSALSAPSVDVTTGPAPSEYGAPSEADGYVDASNPSATYGTLTTLRVDGTPEIRSYLRFTVPALSGPVQQATLRVLANSSSGTGYEAHAANSNSWDEGSLSVATEPGYGAAVLGTSGGVSGGAWTAVDVTSFVTGAGTYSLVLTSSGAAISLASRESGTSPVLEISVVASNGPPVALDDAYSTSSNEVLIAPAPGVLGNDSDPEGGPLTAELAGVLSPSAAGTLALAADGGFTFAPDPAFGGDAAFTYHALDASGQASNEATVTIAVQQPTTQVVLSPDGDSYVDASSSNSNYGSSSTMRADASPERHGYLQFTVPPLADPVTRATLFVRATSGSSSGVHLHGASSGWTEGTLTFANEPGFSATVSGASGPFSGGTWLEFDVTSLVTGPGTHSFVLRTPSSTSINLASRESGTPPVLEVSTVVIDDPPIAGADSYGIATGNTLIEAAPGVLGNDSDPEGGALTAELVTPLTGGAGTLNLAGDGSFDYTPAAGFSGDATFGYRAVDAGGQPSNEAIVRITVVAPVTAVAVPAEADSYVDASSANSNYGSSSTLRPDGSPDRHAYLRFTVPPLAGAATSATLRIYTNSSNGTGIRVHAASTAWDESTLTYANKPGHSATVTAASGGISGGSWVELDVASLVSGGGTYAFVVTTTSNSSISLASREAANKPTLEVDTAAVPNNPPVASNDSASTAQGATLVVAAPGVLGNDSDPEGGPITASLVQDVNPSTGALALAADGGYTFVPAGGYSGPATFTYVALDGAGQPSNEATVSISVVPPSASVSVTAEADTYVDASSANSNYGSSSTLRPDGSPDRHAYVRFTVPPLSGAPTSATLRIYTNSSSGTGIRVHGASASWDESTLTYANEPGYSAGVTASSGAISGGSWVNLDVTSLVSGPGTYGFVVTTTSNSSISLASREAANKPTLEVDTTPIPDDPPIAAGDAASTFEGVTLVVAAPGVLGNDSDPEGGPITASLVQDVDPLAGALTLNADGGYTFVPAVGFLGPATFAYVALDGAGQPSNEATATITVDPVPSVFTVQTHADAYVNSSSGNSNYGSQTLRVDNSPVRLSYVQFDVPDLGGDPSEVTFRIQTETGSSTGITLHASANGWSEGTVTYNNGPAYDPSPIASSGAVSGGTWVEFDASAVVTGPGTYTFVVATPSSSSIRLTNREAGAPAELVVSVSS